MAYDSRERIIVVRKTCYEVARAEGFLITFHDTENQKNKLEVRRGDLGPIAGSWPSKFCRFP